MTISRTYSRTAGDIIEEALRDAKIIPSEQPVSAVEYAERLRLSKQRLEVGADKGNTHVATRPLCTAFKRGPANILA